MLSATHVPLSRHNFLNLSYQKTVGKMKIMMTRKTVVSESSDMDSIVMQNARVQWTLDYPDLDYPDPRLSGSRTEIIARAYNDLSMRVVAVDKKLLYTWLLDQLFCQLKIVRLLDKAVYHSAPLAARPVHSSWLFSPCSQQLVSVYGP